MKNLVTHLTKISPLGDETIASLFAVVGPMTFEKKEIIDAPNSISDRLYIINKGTVREYFIDQKGNDISVWFGFENDVAVCFSSFLSGKKGYTGLQALDDCELVSVHRNDLFDLYDEFPDMERLGRIITEQYFVKTEEYHHGFHHLSATERYELLLKNQPEVISRVAISHIASYLGISIETLSRIRAKNL